MQGTPTCHLWDTPKENGPRHTRDNKGKGRGVSNKYLGMLGRRLGKRVLLLLGKGVRVRLGRRSLRLHPGKLRRLRLTDGVNVLGALQVHEPQGIRNRE